MNTVVTVHIMAPHRSAAGLAGQRVLRELAQRLVRTVENVGDELVRPLVLLGSDLRAVGIATLLADVTPDAAWWPQVAVLAGLPVSARSTTAAWRTS